LEKTYYKGLNRLLTDSKKFEEKGKGKTGEVERKIQELEENR
jgi:hypothetical protein